MSTSGSSRAGVAWLAVLATYAAAMVFWWMQNQWQPVGGAMALQKALWLATAIVLWLILPFLIVTDTRTEQRVRRAFRALLLLMVARGAVELPMLYLMHNWSPWYGIAHDVLCMLVLVWFLAQVAAASLPREALWLTHLAATAAAFIPEIYFAWYMQAYFQTKGTDAIYFVPDDPAHAVALNVTTAAVVCFGAYIAFFLYRWCHAASDRNC